MGVGLVYYLQTDVANLELKRRLAGTKALYTKIFYLLKVQNMDEVKVVLKIVVEEKNASINQSNEIHTLKKLLEEADAERMHQRRR